MRPAPRTGRYALNATVLVAVTVAFVLLAWPAADARYLGSDVMGNISGSSGLGGLADQYPISAYSLDSHVDVGIADLDGVPPTIAQWAATQVWMIVAWVLSLVINLFGWAFSLDLLGGRNGALGPVGDAVRQIYDNVIGRTWLVAAFSAAALWAIWRGLVQRRYADMYTSLAISVVCILVGWFFVFQPQESIGVAAKWSNEMSVAFVSATNRGNVTDGEQAKRQISDHLFETLIYRPWVVLDFGGLRHCVNTDHRDEKGFPQPVAVDSRSADVCRDHIRAHNGYGGYAPRFLEQPAGSDARDALYEALRDGAIPAAHPVNPGPGRPSAGQMTYPAGMFDGWNVDKNDSPAVDVQQAGGAFQRLALVVMVAFGALGAILFLGFIALAIVLAQVLALVLFAFAPVALIIGIFPGAGHHFFKGWLGRLGLALFIKAIYSLALGIVVVVSGALTAATATMPFGLAFGIQAGFFWALVIYRKRILKMASGAMTGSHRATEKVPHSYVRYGQMAVAAPLSTLAGVASPRGRSPSSGAGMPPPTNEPGSHDAATTHTETTRTGTKKITDSSSPPASAGRTYSPPGPPPAEQVVASNGHSSMNGNNTKETVMPGNRVPPRVDKTHIHADGSTQNPDRESVVYDHDRDTSNEPRVPVRVMQHPPGTAFTHTRENLPPRLGDTPLARAFESPLP